MFNVVTITPKFSLRSLLLLEIIAIELKLTLKLQFDRDVMCRLVSIRSITFAMNYPRS